MQHSVYYFRKAAALCYAYLHAANTVRTLKSPLLCGKLDGLPRYREYLNASSCPSGSLGLYIS